MLEAALLRLPPEQQAHVFHVMAPGLDAALKPPRGVKAAGGTEAIAAACVQFVAAAAKAEYNVGRRPAADLDAASLTDVPVQGLETLGARLPALKAAAAAAAKVRLGSPAALCKDGRLTAVLSALSPLPCRVPCGAFLQALGS